MSLDVVENPAVEHLKPGQDATPLPPDLLLHKLAENEVALVEALLGHVMPVDKPVGGAGGGGLADRAVELVRSTEPAALAPFRLDVSGPPTGAVKELVERAVELAALKQADQAGLGVKDMLDAVNFILDARHDGSLRKRAAAEAGVTVGTVGKLEAAIDSVVVVAAGDLAGKLTVQPESLNSPNTLALAGAVRALRPRGRKSISSLIDASRRVFLTPGQIDVRGCNIMRKQLGKPLLEAIRQIFDPAEAAEVSGPTIFAGYPRIDVRVATGAGLDDLKQDGAPEISEEFDSWAFISGAHTVMGGIDNWFSRPFPPRGFGLLDMGVPVPILDRSQSPASAIMFALSTDLTHEGTTRTAARRLLASMWVNKDGSRPTNLIDLRLKRWAEGHPPRTAILTDEEHPDALSPHRIYFQGGQRFEPEGIDTVPPAGRGISLQEINIRF